MKQTIVIEAENDIDLRIALGELDCTVEEFNQMSSSGWRMLLGSLGKAEDIKTISVKTVQ